MREFLFRAKRMDNGEWVEGDLRRFEQTVFTNKFEYYITPYKVRAEAHKTDLNFRVSFISPCYQVIPETIGEYTGLTDKEGKRIFEGDILSAHFDADYPENETIAIILWHNFGWYIKQANCKLDEDMDRLSQGDSEYWRVKGNIHDNKVLGVGEKEDGSRNKNRKK